MFADYESIKHNDVIILVLDFKIQQLYLSVYQFVNIFINNCQKEINYSIRDKI